MYNYLKVNFTILLISILLSNILYADTNFLEWLNRTKVDAIEIGIKEKTYLDSIKNLKKINPKVLSYYNNQPEFKISFSKYYTRNISSKRIQSGINHSIENKKILEEVYSKFNIPIEIILAIWGMESNYGKYTGGFNVLESLSTLAYASRRNAFFKKEFLNTIKIIDSGLISKELLQGSWAGAMGQSQFMPSSYLNYAIDFNNDNKIDIWNSKSDIFASISNYLKKNGWKEKEPWSIELDKDKVSLIKKLSLNTFDYETLKKHSLLNKRFLEKYKEKIEGKLKIVDEEKQSRYFIIFYNFNIIKRYNNSDFYALTVGELANKIEKR